ncbi:MAG TPA: DoxX family protein [Terriglobia bacterium]|nr:DoxX family protein [Terriglobia bacterium]
MPGNRQARGIAILRIIVGIVFMMHGGQKILVIGIANFSGALHQLGIPLPHFFGLVVPLVEFFGGLALLLGLFTGWAAALLSCDMLVALFRVHLRHGFFLPTGFEYVLTLLAANVAIFLTGPGSLSVGKREWP